MTVLGVPAPAPTSKNADRLPALRACLNAVRMRSRVGSMLRGAVFSLVAALVLLCGFEIFTLYSGGATPAALSDQSLSHLTWSAAAFVLALVLATLLAYLLTPDLAVLACMTERVLSLQERLSTALEVDARLPPPAAPGPVAAALLADAERHAATVDPRQIVRLDLPRAIWAVPMLIAAAVLLHLVPPDALAVSRGPVAGMERDGGSFSGQQGADAAANLRRIAERVGKDAEERSDPYLRTIARTLERLSSEAERPGADRREVANALSQLLGHARQAYGQASNANSGTTQRDVMQQLQAALDDIAGSRQAGSAAPREPDGGSAAANVAAAQPGQTGRPAQPLERRAAGGRPSSEIATPGPPPANWDELLKNLDDYDPVDPRIEKERAFAEQQRRARAAAQSAGAAQDAGQGEGDRAGDGTRPLGSGGANVSTELVPGAEMLLPEQADNSGRRIRIELPPEVALSGVAPPTAANGTDWQRLQEQATERSAVGTEERKVIGRYFIRPAGSGGK